LADVNFSLHNFEVFIVGWWCELFTRTTCRCFKFLYLLYDVSGLEFTEKRKLNIGFVLATGVILVIALGLWIGWLTSRKVMAPVSHLAEQVDKSGPNNLPTDLSRHFYQDEVGVLARVLEYRSGHGSKGFEDGDATTCTR
jgi:methyl-accepting chemotaxis protein